MGQNILQTAGTTALSTFDRLCCKTSSWPSQRRNYYERFSFWIAMKFKVTKSSDYTYESTIEINTLEELIEFQKTCGCEIILIDENEIEIYDDFRE